MVNKVLTDTFANSLKPVDVVLFPKSIPKKKKTMLDYIKPRKHLKLLKKHALSLRVKRKKLPSIKSLKTKADASFSKFIRNRDGNKCVLCSSTVNIQCGHLIKRGKMSTRYDEINCHALCSGCNYKDNFEPQHYLSWFLNNYRVFAFDSLIDKSKQLVKANREFFLEIIKRYDTSNPKP